MNLYGLIGLLVIGLIAAAYFDLGPPILQVFTRLADVPEFTTKGSNPALFDLAVRLAYLIVIVSIIKLLVRRRDDE